jgi:hypothetical protein
MSPASFVRLLTKEKRTVLEKRRAPQMPLSCVVARSGGDSRLDEATNDNTTVRRGIRERKGTTHCGDVSFLSLKLSPTFLAGGESVQGPDKPGVCLQPLFYH